MLTGQPLGANLSATANVRRATLLLMVTAQQQTVGANVRRLRREKGISPGDFAQSLNIATKTLERWERGETNGGITHIDRLGELLEIEPAHLMAKPAEKSNGTPDPFSPSEDDRLAHIEELLAAVVKAVSELGTAQERLERTMLEAGRAQQSQAAGRKRAQK